MGNLVIQKKIDPILFVDTPVYTLGAIPPSPLDIFLGPSYGSSTTILVFGGENSAPKTGGLCDESPGHASMEGSVSIFTSVES